MGSVLVLLWGPDAGDKTLEEEVYSGPTMPGLCQHPEDRLTGLLTIAKGSAMPAGIHNTPPLPPALHTFTISFLLPSALWNFPSARYT